jgi:hypothetical protein
VLDSQNEDFSEASEAAYGMLTATVERCRAAGRLHGRDPEVVAVSAWSLVHGLSALWISGRLAGRIAEQNPDSLASAVSALFVEAVLPPPQPGHQLLSAGLPGTGIETRVVGC